MSLTPAQRAHLAKIGRLGGLTTAATIDTHERALTGQSKFRDAFLYGHGCKLCNQVDIPMELPLAERKRRADLLYTIHFGRLARARWT
jgi:hypothetical protein